MRAALACGLLAVAAFAACGGAGSGGAGQGTPTGDAGTSSSGGGSGGSSSSGSSGGGSGGDASTGSSSGADSGKAAGDSGQPGGDSGVPGDGATGKWWSPTNGAPTHFHWELSTAFADPGDVVPGQGTIVYDIDGENNTAATVSALHALGPNVKVICYVDVGTWEDFRSDASQFPASVLGMTNGWPGEKWLDVRQQSILLPIMKARMQNWCVAKGFDAVEPDNLDGWQNTTGFPLTQADNLSYDLAIAAMVHSLGLSVGLKNLPQNAVSLEPNFDWAIDEQCFEFSECSSYQGWTSAGKPVFDVEYNVAPDCTQAGMLKMNAQKRDLNLVGPSAAGYVYSTCIPDSQTTW